MSQIIVKFKPGPEEELMTAMASLMQRMLRWKRQEMVSCVPDAIKDTLVLCYRKFFGVEAARRSPAHASLANALRSEYESNLLPILPPCDVDADVVIPNPLVCACDCLCELSKFVVMVMCATSVSGTLL